MSLASDAPPSSVPEQEVAPLSASREPPRLGWQAAFEPPHSWQVHGFGPAQAHDDQPAIGLLTQDGQPHLELPAGTRWVLVRAGPQAGTPAPADLGSATALAMGADGAAMLVDRQARRTDIIHGRDARAPAFLVRSQDGRLTLVEGVAALRGRLAGHAPASLGVTHFLGFGHVPAGGLMQRGVWPIQPGEMLSVGWDADGRITPGILAPADPPPLRSPEQWDEALLAERLARAIAPAVAGHRIAILATRPGPATAWLEAACQAAGAAAVTRLGPDRLPASLAPVQSAAIALTGQPMADPALLGDAALALEAPADCKALLLDWGADSLVPSHPALLRFAGRLARTELATTPLRNVAGGFLRIGRFARDLLFDEVGVFPDEERFRIAGPALLGDGFLAMGDEFGDALEEVPPALAAALAGQLDPALRPGAAVSAMRSVMAGMTGRTVLAPFLDPAVSSLPLGPAAAPSGEPLLRPADIAADRLASILGPSAAVFASGLLTRTTPLVRLFAQGENATARERRQAFALLALEKWLRIVGVTG